MHIKQSVCMGRLHLRLVMRGTLAAPPRTHRLDVVVHGAESLVNMDNSRIDTLLGNCSDP
jgi:hypothetical protein